MLRVTNPGNLAEAAPQSSSQGDTFAVIHVPAACDFAAALRSQSLHSDRGQSNLHDPYRTEGGWPVVVAMVEEFLGIRIDHIAQLESDALGRVIDELGGLQVYSRAAFSAGSTDFVEGTNNLDGATSSIFTAANPVDDAGQRDRNQRAVVRALVQGLKSGGLVKDPSKGRAMLGHFARDSAQRRDRPQSELVKIANNLRTLQTDDIAVITVPTNSRREDDGTVIINFDPEVVPALKNSLTSNDLAHFFRYLITLGY